MGCIHEGVTVMQNPNWALVSKDLAHNLAASKQESCGVGLVWGAERGCSLKGYFGVRKERVLGRDRTSHLKGAGMGCLYQSSLSGFYSGDECALKTNTTSRKKLVARMTVFLVAKPSVLLQQLTEGYVDACVCVCLRGWMSLAAVGKGMWRWGSVHVEEASLFVSVPQGGGMILWGPG